MATNLTGLDKPTKLSAFQKLAQRIERDYATKAEIPTDVSDLGNSLEYQTKSQVESAINAKVSSTYRPGGSVTSSALPTPSADNLGMVYNVSDKFTTDATFLEGTGQTHPAGTNIVVVQDGGGYKFDVLAGFFDTSGLAEKVSGATNGHFAALDGNGNLTDSGKSASDFVVAESGKGLSTNDYTTAEQTKLAGVADGATKVEQSSTNGNIKVNGNEMTVYTLPEELQSLDFATDEEVEAVLDDVFGED